MMSIETSEKQKKKKRKSCFASLSSHVKSVSLKGLDGFDQDAVVDFSKGLNIIHSISGGGKTRLVQWILEGVDRPFSMGVAEDEFAKQLDGTPLSLGESIMMTTGIMLMTSSPDSCLVLDDLLPFLDPENTDKFLKMLVAHDGQVILTADSYAIEGIREILEGERVKYIDLGDMHSADN